MNKRVKLVIIAIIIIVVLFLFINRNKNQDNKIINYLIKNGFDSHIGEVLYTKRVSDVDLDNYNINVNRGIDSEYEALYFNVLEFDFSKDKMSYSNGISKSFTSKYNYTNNEISYVYRINVDNTNVIVEGIYSANDNKFTCDSTFVYLFDFESSKNDICNKVKLELENFNYEANQLIPNVELLNYMKEKRR